MREALAHSPSGHLELTIEGQMAFVPDSLPREMPLSSPLVYQLDEASRAVATLAGVGETIPNPHLLVRPFMRREAVLSSRIEGTQASLSDLFRYEASGLRRPRGDVLEVFNYILALEEGLRLLPSLPISVRLLDRVHAFLMRSVRGAEKQPGRFRDSQNWIGADGVPISEARYVPPPPQAVWDSIGDWERFANEDLEIPPLVACAMLHYQFEAIHPYLDGNGRIGRLLIVLYLCAKKVLPTPLLYLSAYFERDRAEYYDQLLALSSTGDWEAWLAYFLRGVKEQATDALDRARRIRELRERYRRLLTDRHESANALRLVDELFAAPYMTAPRAATQLGVTYAGARGILDRLEEAGILRFEPDASPKLYVATELLETVEGKIQYA